MLSQQSSNPEPQRLVSNRPSFAQDFIMKVNKAGIIFSVDAELILKRLFIDIPRGSLSLPIQKLVLDRLAKWNLHNLPLNQPNCTNEEYFDIVEDKADWMVIKLIDSRAFQDAVRVAV